MRACPMSLISSCASGVYPISVTPFLDNGAIDFDSMDRLTDFFIETGVPGVTLLGILGEASKLTAAESLDPVSYTHLTLPTICSV